LQQYCFILDARSAWLPAMAQKNVLLLSEKPVIHDAGLMDVGLHQSAGMGLYISLWSVAASSKRDCRLTQSVERLLSHAGGYFLCWLPFKRERPSMPIRSLIRP